MKFSKSRIRPAQRPHSFSYKRTSAFLFALGMVSIFSTVEAYATTYYVDNTIAAASDSNAGTSATSPWRTLGKAASRLVAGDTVIVVAGRYDERVTPVNSGTSSSGITYKAASSVRPVVRGFTLSGKQFITVNGFEITSQGFSSDGNPSVVANSTTGLKILNNYIHDTATMAIRSSPYSDAAKSINMQIKGNTIAYTGPAGSRANAIQIWGDGTLIENNDISHNEDFVRVHGNHIVVRNNTMHDGIESDAAGAHIDGVQSFCVGTNPAPEAANFVLIEGNTFRDNPGVNTHFALINATDTCGGTTGIILRHNLIVNLGSITYVADTNQSFGYHHKYYNNTTVRGRLGSTGQTTVMMNGIANGSMLNNLFTDAVDQFPAKMYALDASGTSKADYNFAFQTSGSVSWTSPLSGEPHVVLNKNPLFVSTTNFNLQSLSPARDAGGNLTKVAAGDSGTGVSLKVDDAYFFQAGWANTTPDWIAVGNPANAAQIVSIDYSTQTLTLSAALSRSAGQPVWLYKKSDNTQILQGSAPDIGAFELGATAAPPAGDTTPPTVSMTAPAIGTTVKGSAVVVSATASDNVGVVGVQFKMDGANLGAEDTTSPYSISWNSGTTPNGGHTLTAVARDAAGNRTTSTSVAVTVSNTTSDTTPPTVSMTAPGSGATVKGTAVLSASASDNVGVAGVQFKLNGANVGAEDTTSPYTISWNTTTVSNGTYTLTAVARDAAANKTTSTAVTVNVSNTPQDTTPPMVSITAPGDGDVVKGSVAVSASVSDENGVVGVQFKLDGANLGPEDTTSPFGVNWSTTTIPNDSYTLTAVARDAAGNKTTSIPVTVTVTNATSRLSYTISDNGGQAWQLTAGSSSAATQLGQIQPDSGNRVPSGTAVVAFRNGTTIVNETEVPASEPVSSGRVDVEVSGPVTSGVALANPGPNDATVSFYFTDKNGTNFGSRSFVLRSSDQISGYFDQAPFNGPAQMTGTFTFVSSSPISAVGLRGYINERNEFLMSTLRVAPLGNAGSGMVTLPLIIDGDGWTTQIVLTNPTDSRLTGTLKFYVPTSGYQTVSMSVKVNGTGAATFNYSIPPRSRFQITTDGAANSPRKGFVRVTPGSSTAAPTAHAILTQKPNAVTVSRTVIPGLPAASALRTYVESSSPVGASGEYVDSVLAFSNPSSASTTIRLEFLELDGTPTALTASVSLPGRGHVTRAVNDLIKNMPANFRGILRISSSRAVSVVGLRERQNDRGDYLLSTIDIENEAAAAPKSAVFPLLVEGGGYETKLIIFSGAPGGGGSGDIILFDSIP